MATPGTLPRSAVWNARNTVTELAWCNAARSQRFKAREDLIVDSHRLVMQVPTCIIRKAIRSKWAGVQCMRAKSWEAASA